MQNISHTITHQLMSLKEKKGALAFEDLSTILDNVAIEISKTGGAAEKFLHDEIRKIASHIETTRQEIAALAPERTPGATIGSAAEQLDAVIKATEAAAHTLMDAADEIQTVVSTAAMSDDVKAKISEITSRIYEACNFQDLTSQRITKVMKALEYTENRVRKLISLFGSDGTLDMKEFAKAVQDERPDAHLLNGPQLPGASPSQQDIDALFGKA